MSRLLDELREQLGGTYRIERELGGGGMSRVFVAEESALGRHIVLKVLPPELAPAVSAERFEREIRVAAQLQHPHIVPLLAAGRAGQTLYYTMPLVEGESLRTRLNRERELPVAEAVRLLREMADALAYAHRAGVVHRDIKPDNILLSHRHAMITDFGVARAVTEAAGEASLTHTGMVVGTPAYMAPEQAAGDGLIDQRADLYALGVVAYEMLAGHPPFRGATQQALVVAQLTHTPAPLTRARPSVPHELAAIVHRCLEKRPADRFADATELLAELDRVAAVPATTPAAQVAQPAPREWSLPRVLGWFGLTASATAGVAWALRTLLGLPDWFFAAAVLLLALGLPVVVLATVAHNRRARDPDRTPLPLPRALHARLSLRNAVTGGLVAFGLLGVCTGAYAAMRTLGLGPAGTLVASGRLAARDRFIIADFNNQTRDTLLGPALTEAFRIDFSQSKLASPVEPTYIRSVLRRMERADANTIDLDLAREIAQREGIKAVIAGELQQVGPSLLVTARLINAESNEVLASARETARDSTQILDAVDRVSKHLRARIGESLRTIRGNAALPDVTTRSLDALRRYAQALRIGGGASTPEALALLEEALAADSTFAMAWRRLGTQLFNVGGGSVRASDALTRAFHLRDRLTFRERRLTEFSYYMDVVAAPDSAAAALESLLRDYPDDTWALNNLAVVYGFARNADGEQRALLQRAIVLDPEQYLPYSNLFFEQIAAGQFDSAAITMDTIRVRFQASPEVDALPAYLALGRRDYRSGEALVRELLQRHAGNPQAQTHFTQVLAGVLTIRGKLAQAEQTSIAAERLFMARGLAGRAIGERVRRAPPLAQYLGDAGAARARLEAILRATPLAALEARERPLYRVIDAAIGADHMSLAEVYLREFLSGAGAEPGRVRPNLTKLVRAQVLSSRPDSLNQAIAEIRSVAGGCNTCKTYGIAQAFDRAGMADSALAYYEGWDAQGDNTWIGPGVYRIEAPLIWRRMGELYENRGERAQAARYYTRFTDVWSDADPVLQPRVREVEQRLAALVESKR